MNSRFKFRIAVYERQENNLSWEFVEYIGPDNQHWGLNQCGDIISDSSYSAHYTRKNAPDSVHRVYEPEMSTGLKDKNGNLIYEGDILLCERKIVDCATGAEIHCKSSGVVQREKNGKYFINGKDWYGSDITFYNECAEIIGNIHEQTEQGGAKCKTSA